MKVGTPREVENLDYRAMPHASTCAPVAEAHGLEVVPLQEVLA